MENINPIYLVIYGFVMFATGTFALTIYGNDMRDGWNKRSAILFVNLFGLIALSLVLILTGAFALLTTHT